MHSWTSSCGCYDSKVHLSNNHQGTWQKQVLLLTCPGRAHSTPAERKKAQTWGSVFIGVKGVMPRIYWVPSVLMNLNI